MKRNEFIKKISISSLGLALVPKTPFFQEQTYSTSQLIGKGNPDIEGNTYTSKMHKRAKISFLKMQKQAAKDGISIAVVSAYRSFDRQIEIFENKYKNYISQGLKPLVAINKIITYSTIPGTSRHHWGTDLDLIDTSVPRPKNVLQASHFEGNGVFCRFKEWMDVYANDFGFFLVYTDNPKRKGFKYEPWHYSYAPISVPMLAAYKKLNLSAILAKEKILGNTYFTEQFLENYKKNHILDINPKLL